MQDEPFTPDVDDAYFAPAGQLGTRTVASFSGRFLGEYEDDDAAVSAICRAMKDAAFWPNVWNINDHGNATLVEITDYDAGTWKLSGTAYV